MSENSCKKTIIFSSSTTKQIIDRIVGDECICYNKQPSAIIEDHILSTMLPTDRTAADMITRMYSGEWTASQVICSHFSLLAAQVEADTSRRNSRRLVEMLHVCSCTGTELKSADTAYRAVLSQDFDEIFRMLCNLHGISADNLSEFSGEWYIKRIAIKLSRPDSRVLLSEIYALILENWDDLCSSKLTYMLLNDIVEFSDPLPDTAEFRVKVNNLFKEMSSEWMIETNHE